MATKVRLPDWMADLPDSVKERPFNVLAIPGSHDSLTYAIKKTAAPAPDLEEPILKLYSMVPISKYIISPFLKKWCKTQKYSVLHQLKAGIRYFDLRVAPKKEKVVAIVHGLFSDALEPNLKKFNKFLEAHNQEVVILDFQHFYNFTPDLHQNLINTLKSTFDQKICPKMKSASISLKELVSKNYRVIIVYRDEDYSGRESKLWIGDTWPTFWPDTMSPNSMIEYCESTLKERSMNCGSVNQFVLTFNDDLIKRKPFAGVKNACAKQALPVAQKWLNERARQFSPSVVISDYVNMENDAFSKGVIALNFDKNTTVNFTK